MQHIRPGVTLAGHAEIFFVFSILQLSRTGTRDALAVPMKEHRFEPLLQNLKTRGRMDTLMTVLSVATTLITLGFLL